MMKERIKNYLLEYLSTENLTYEYISDDSEESIYFVKMESDLGVFDCYINIHDDQNLIEVISHFPLKIMENKKQEIGIHLHEINKKLFFGNFEFDFVTGEIRVKTYMLTENIIENSFINFSTIFQRNHQIIDEFIPGCLEIAYGNVDSTLVISSLKTISKIRLN
jgi:hypothetical protein